MITEKELQQIKEKYSYYLSQAYIDIAWSQTGKAYFIEYDKYGKCNSFYIAETAKELNTIIKMNLFENLECIMDISIEEMNHQLQGYNMQAEDVDKSVNYEERLQILVEKMELVLKSIRRVYGEVLKG